MAITKKDIEESLMIQLKSQNKEGVFFCDLVADYLYFYGMKKKLKTDINKNGLRIMLTNGNGIDVEKPNESVQNLIKVNSQMLKILSDLNLKEPTNAGDGDPSDYL